MANQTLPLNVSDEMKLDDKREILFEEPGAEELCSSSATDTCRDCVPLEQPKTRLSH